jgi:hypothetical protein
MLHKVTSNCYVQHSLQCQEVWYFGKSIFKKNVWDIIMQFGSKMTTSYDQITDIVVVKTWPFLAMHFRWALKNYHGPFVFFKEFYLFVCLFVCSDLLKWHGTILLRVCIYIIVVLRYMQGIIRRWFVFKNCFYVYRCVVALKILYTSTC